MPKITLILSEIECEYIQHEAEKQNLDIYNYILAKIGLCWAGKNK